MIHTRFDIVDLISDYGKTGVEIGVHKGEFARYTLEHSKLRKLYLVDPWEGYRRMDGDAVLEECKRNLAGFEDRYEIVRMRSPEAASMFEDGSLKWCYIDGDHSYRGCMRDMLAWWPKVARFGVFAGHDFCNRNGYGVIDAVNDFFNVRNDFHVTDKDGKFPSWWFVK